MLNKVLGGLGGLGGGKGGMVGVVSQLLEQAGGISGLQKILATNGLASQVASWIGTGANQSVTGGQLGQALEKGGLGNLIGQAAGQLNMNSESVQSQLAGALPAIIDKLTPNGEIPAGDGKGLDLSTLTGLAGKLFG